MRRLVGERPEITISSPGRGWIQNEIGGDRRAHRLDQRIVRLLVSEREPGLLLGIRRIDEQGDDAH